MLQRLGFPPVGRHRRFVTAIGIDAVGSGLFIPITILYFLATTDLSLVRIGTALSVAALVALPAGPLIGSAVDRLGPKRVLLAANLMQAVGYVAYLGSDSFLAVAGWTTLLWIGTTSFWSSYGNLVALISAPGERERWFGFLGALRNVGFALGGLLAGLVISVGSPLAYSLAVAANAASYLVALVLLLAVPDGATPAREAAAGSARVTGSWRTVLADGPYRVLWLAQLGFAVAMLALNLAIPVYLVTTLGLPGWVTGVAFTLNCVVIGAGQGLVVRAMTGHTRWVLLLLAQAAFGVSFLVLLCLRWLATPAAVAVGLLAVLVFTVGELLGNPVTSALTTEAAPAHLRGRYLSLIQMAWSVAGVVAPAGYSWLLDHGGLLTWSVLAGMCAVSGLVATWLGRVLPLAAAPVTNRASVSPLPIEPVSP